MAVFQADRYRCLALLVSSYRTRGFRHIASSFFAGKPRSNVGSALIAASPIYLNL